MNIVRRQLTKIDKYGPAWIDYTRRFNPVIAEYLRQYWPLDCPCRVRSRVE